MPDYTIRNLSVPLPAQAAMKDPAEPFAPIPTVWPSQDAINIAAQILAEGLDAHRPGDQSQGKGNNYMLDDDATSPVEVRYLACAAAARSPALMALARYLVGAQPAANSEVWIRSDERAKVLAEVRALLAGVK